MSDNCPYLRKYLHLFFKIQEEPTLMSFITSNKHRFIPSVFSLKANLAIIYLILLLNLLPRRFGDRGRPIEKRKAESQLMREQLTGMHNQTSLSSHNDSVSRRFKSNELN